MSRRGWRRRNGRWAPPQSCWLVVPSSGITRASRGLGGGVMAPRRAVSVRFPADLLAQAKAVQAPGESLNDLVVGLVEREVRRRRGLAAHERIMRIREEVL